MLLYHPHPYGYITARHPCPLSSQLNGSVPPPPRGASPCSHILDAPTHPSPVVVRFGHHSKATPNFRQPRLVRHREILTLPRSPSIDQDSHYPRTEPSNFSGQSLLSSFDYSSRIFSFENSRKAPRVCANDSVDMATRAMASAAKSFRELHGVVVSAGLMDRTVKVQVGGLKWNTFLKKVCQKCEGDGAPLLPLASSAPELDGCVLACLSASFGVGVGSLKAFLSQKEKHLLSRSL